MAGDWKASHGIVRRLSALAAVLVLLPLLAVACSSGSKSANKSANAPTTFAQPQPTTVTATGASASASAAKTASATATVPPDNSPIAEFLMPKFGVDAKTVVLGIDQATNTMQSPNNKDDVGYYNFTSLPGSNCSGPGQCPNTVVAGHVDWYTGQWGVFQHLRDLKMGDVVELKLTDGTLYKYKVVSNELYPDDNAPVAQIIGKTPQPSITMITCDGVFNKAAAEYNMRRVVRAVREA